MTLRHQTRRLLTLLLLATPLAHAAERITLKSGFEFDCIRRVPTGLNVRLYFTPASPTDEGNYLEVPLTSITHIETIPDPTPTPAPTLPPPAPLDLHQLLAAAGTAHHIDVDLLSSLVHAESGGRVRAVSRTGARGLMQLMPGTAAALGVKDSFLPSDNVEGGTRYLDQLLTRYHDNIALALAAYNAGPGAVDRFHGIPPFRETRLYVARIIRDFNRLKTAQLRTPSALLASTLPH